ncbi:SIP5 [Apiospora arundinis]
MGNTSTKEARGGGRHEGYEAGGSSRSGGHGHHGEMPDRSSRRTSHRPERNTALNILTGGASSSSRREHREREDDDAPFQSRETRAEREQRRLNKERQLRAIERARSMAEEHVDGGFLVTTGIYPASEDWDHSVVRQLQLERRIAPYWRGLDDFKETWAEHQIIAAARGLDIPPADEVPEGLVPQPLSPNESIQNLTVPMGGRTMSASSERTGSNPGSSLPSPTSPTPTHALKPHKRAMAAVMSNISSRNGSQQDFAPREVNVTPDDPFVNGQPREVFLYKDGLECPICCMYYPRFLNTTRCCGQSICSECFVQIKRADPHLPEHHGDQPQEDADPSENAEELIMEPACCPYCQQPEFGITYEPPPFKRGLVYSAPGLGAMGTAMSSTSSLNTANLSPTSANTPATANRRRTHSLSANAPNVITTDRIRPDWSNKLNAARAQQRRRAAAADALHQAAFFMPGGSEQRGLFGRSSRFTISRRSTRGADSPGAGASNEAEAPAMADPGARSSSARTGPSREAINAAHLESMMMAEAIRLSLADEEERRKKEEKEADKQAKKDAKKKEKEERKSRRKSSISGITGTLAAASASSLSLGLGLRRRNSASASTGPSPAATAASANTAASQSTEALPAISSTTGDTVQDGSKDKGKAVERATTSESMSQTSQATSSNSSLPIPISQPPRGASHLRQISNASSISSSGVESHHGSYPQAQLGAEDPRGSGLSLADGKSDDEGAGTESMFNFTSLSQMVGVELGGEQAVANKGAAVDEQDAAAVASTESDKESVAHHEHVENAPTATTGEIQEKSHGEAEDSSSSTATTPAGQPVSPPAAMETIREKDSGAPELKTLNTEAVDNPNAPRAEPPSLMVTPETPAPMSEESQESKQLGYSN